MFIIIIIIIIISQNQIYKWAVCIIMYRGVKQSRKEGSSGSGCTTTSQPIYCQRGRKSASLSASLEQLSPEWWCTDVPDWVTTSAVHAINPPFGTVTVLILNATVASCHTKQVQQPWGRFGLGRCHATQSRCLRKELLESDSLTVSGWCSGSLWLLWL